MAGGVLADLGAMIVYLSANSSQFDKVIASSQSQLEAASHKMVSLGTKLSLGVTTPLVAFGTKALHTFANFDENMTKSTSIMSGVTSDLRREMEETARSISLKSATAASDLAEGYYFLASAGLSAKQSIAALPAVEKFATAGAFNLADATSYLCDAQSALGLKSQDATENMTNMVRVSDVLVDAANAANASVEEFSQALTNKAASRMKSLNKDVEEGVAVLAAFADQGKKGKIAGEMYNIMMRDFQAASSNNKQAWDAMGLSIYDTQGKMLPTVQILKSLEDKFGNLSVQQRYNQMSMLGFQEAGADAINMLFGLSGRVADYEKRLRAAGGATDTVAKLQMMSFTNQLKIIYHHVEDLNIELGRILAPTVLKVGETIKALVNWWRGLNDETKTLIVYMGAVVAAFGPGLVIFGKLLGLFSLIISALRYVKLGVTAVWTAIQVGGLAALAPFAYVIAIVAAVGAAIAGVVYIVLGPAGLKACWGIVWQEIKTFGQNALGFFSHFEENMGILVDWIKENWWDLLKDVGAYIVSSITAYIHNMQTFATTILRIISALAGWLVAKWKSMFSFDFLIALYEGLVAAIKMIWGWGKNVVEYIWSVLTSAFTGEPVAKALTFGADIAGKFKEGFESQNIGQTISGIVREGFYDLETPLTNFKSNLKTMPKLNLEINTKQAADEMKEVADAASKVKGDQRKEEAQDALGGAGQTTKQDFKEISLRRFSLSALSNGSKTQFKEVTDKGVQARLDTLIDVERSKKAFQLG